MSLSLFCEGLQPHPLPLRRPITVTEMEEALEHVEDDMLLAVSDLIAMGCDKNELFCLTQVEVFPMCTSTRLNE